MNTLGRHILVEFFGCSSEILNDVPHIENAMVEAAKDANATVINSTFHHFSPFGVSGVVVIQESHLAIHTWPEYQYAAVDIFTCGTEVDPWISYDFLKNAFEAEYGSAMELLRGQISMLKRVEEQHGLNIEALREEAEQSIAPRFTRNVWFTDRDENQALSLRHTGDVLFREKSPYQLVEVYNTYGFGKMLTVDKIIMTTEKDEFIYHEMIAHLPMFTHSGPKKVLVIGGGDGGTIREVLRHEDVEQVKMVEIDEAVVRASKKHLPSISTSFDHPKLELFIDDGIKYAKECANQSYDVIIIDGSDPEGPAEGLFSESFYRNIHRILKENGVLVSQSESPFFTRQAFIDIHRLYKKLFGEENAHSYLAYIPTYPSGMWSFTMACKGNAHPIHSYREKAAAKFSQENELKYYTPGMHKAAMELPPFVKKMLE